MKVGTHYGNPENDRGQWFTWAKVGEERVELLVRAVPGGKQRRVLATALGSKVGQRERVRFEQAAREKAAFALLDSRGFEYDAADEQGAEAFTRVFGRPVSIGDLVLFDGRWSQDVKAYVFEELVPDLVGWINEKSDSLRLKATEEEEGKDES